MAHSKKAGIALVGASLLFCACDGESNDGTQASAGTLGGLSSTGSGTDGTGDTTSTPGGSGEGSSGGSSGGDGPKFDLGAAPSGDLPEEEECAAVSEAAELVPLPADIIFVVDNSGSMTFEAAQVQERLNDFSTQIIDSGIDVHVVLISSYPNSGNGICIDPPLGAGGCPGSDTNLPLFNHVNRQVSSSSAWADILNTAAQWTPFMRAESSKHVVVISDDDPNISAEAFNTGFTGLDPTYAEYIHHSVVSHSNCPTAADIGQPYIDLTNDRGGVAADLCDQDFQAVFDALSTEVIGGTQLACEFEIPEPPNGESFDPDKVNVEFNDGLGGILPIPRVDSAAECAAVLDGWYYDNPAAPTRIVMCPQTCEEAQVAKNGSISIAFGCETIVPG
ncbi:MAG: vWA domain-containing protein [Nannocystales bacterium]